MAILALDLGTSCGWALELATKTAPLVSGCWDLRPGKFDGGGMRFVKFRNQLNLLHDANRISQVVYEGVRRHLGVDAAHIYGGLMAHLQSWCEDKSIPYAGVSVQAIKKFATGKGNASKDEVTAAVESWGFRPCNDDEADAIALLRLCQVKGVS